VIFFCAGDAIIQSRKFFIRKLKEKAIIIDILDVLDAIMTKMFIENELPRMFSDSSEPQIFSVKIPFWAFFRKHNTSSDMSIRTVNYTKMIENIVNGNRDRLPSVFENISDKMLTETMRPPEYFIRSDGVKTMRDRQSEFFNIEGGFRKTTNQPGNFIGTVYLFGNEAVLGLGSSDENTIASKLQKIIDLPLKIENYSNCFGGFDFGNIFPLINSISFRPNDIIILLLPELRSSGVELHWFDWGSCCKPIRKFDATELFDQVGRPDIYLTDSCLTDYANQRIAELLRNIIYDNIALFDPKKYL
jgi:hypothetical protein